MEFKSKLEETLPAEELNFEPTPGFKGHYESYLDHSIAHPAKMSLNLLEFLISTYTKENDVVLDPMAGTGSTGIVASLKGRDAVLVELEDKFVGWINVAKGKVDRQNALLNRGSLVVLKGDARRLSKLLTKETNVIVTSPPYGNRLSDAEVKDGDKQRMSYALAGAQDKQNIGGLPLKEVNAIVTSPPYSEGIGHSQGKRAGHDLVGKDSFVGYYGDGDKNNIGNLKHGEISTIITSPPYSNSVTGESGIDWTKEKREDGSFRDRSKEPAFNHLTIYGAGFKYSDDKKNIGNLRHGTVDAIITSPPYSETIHKRAEYSKRVERLKQKDINFQPLGKSVQTQDGDEYVKSKDNIGNLKRETYLSAMLQVYGEMFKVLKQGGLAVVVIKPFIRDKRVVDLPFQTWQLMEKAGFKLKQVYKLRLKNASFWRILYSKKYPDVQKISHEYVIVAQKS